MIIVLTGNDTFRSRERLQQLRAAFVTKYDPSGINVATLDGAGLKVEDFQRAVASQGMFSSRRFVAVDRPYEADQKTQQGIVDLLKATKVPEETIVVFWDPGATETKRRGQKVEAPLQAALVKVKHRESFDPLEPAEVERWILRRAADRGGQLDRAGAEQLAAAAGSDLWLAANEIEKLVHQYRGQRIGVRQVEESIREQPEANIFAFTDALSRKDARAALRLLEEQFASGANELYLLTMIGRQVRILLSVSDLAAEEPNPTTIARRLALHPFVVKKALEQVRTFSRRELLAAHDAIVEIDRQLKTSRGNPRALLELLVVRLCAGRPVALAY